MGESMFYFFFSFLPTILSKVYLIHAAIHLRKSGSAVCSLFLCAAQKQAALPNMPYRETACFSKQALLNTIHIAL